MTDAPLWTGLGLVAALEARVSGTPPRGGVAGVSIDTRSLKGGELYVAIRGDLHDGHDFVAQAFAAGAAAAVVDEAHAPALRASLDASPIAAAGDRPCLYVVDDALRALERLGRAARARSAARVVAVTGSVGKTTVKEMLRLVLSDAGPTHASAASFNNHWGVPLTLARLPADARYGVFEIGMNHPGEITPLVDQVQPDIAVVTTVAAAHLEHFSGVEEIADAKAEIFSGLVRGGLAVVNRDIGTYERLRAAAEASAAGRVLTFGEHADADARLEFFAPTRDGAEGSARVLGRRVDFRLGAPGRHLAVNALSVLLAARGAGLDLDAAADSLARFTVGQGRGARSVLRLPGGDASLIDESYNANPTSMRAALAVLAAAAPAGEGRRVAVIGDMRELGPDAERLHAELLPDLEAAGVDLVYAAGPLSHALFSRLPAGMRGLWGETAAAIEGALADGLRAGDVVMVKGSNGSRMGPLVAALKDRFRAAPAGRREPV